MAHPAYLVGAPVVLALAVVGWLWLGDAAPEATAPLPVIAAVPDFSLIERSGRTVTREDLMGRVWVADFIFTSCAGPCPEMTLRMRSLQRGLEGVEGVKLVSFSVDPETDTPAVLRRYADRFGAGADRWLFLTGLSEEQMHELVQKGFLQAISPASQGSPLIHSTRFVLIGKQGHIRGWYDGLDAASKPVILRDIQRLLDEPSV